MKKKQGFTLIELLAVIVILAIIALIATPMVLNTIDKAKEGAFEQTINGVVKAVDLYKARIQLTEQFGECRYFSFGSDVTEVTERDGKTYYPLKELSIKGKLPTEGEIKVCSDELLIDASDGSYSGRYENEELNVTKGDLASSDLTTPIIDTFNITSTTDKIIVTVAAHSQSVGGIISNYYYKIDDGKYNKTTEQSYVFEKLKAGQEYTITIMVENKSGITTEESKKITTKSFGELTIDVEDSNKWTSSKNVTINGTTEEYKIEYKIRKYNEETKEIEESSFLEYKESFKLDTMATNDYPILVIARYNDNGSYSNEKTYTVVNIDTTSPTNTKPVVNVSTTKPTSEASIVIRQDDSESGLNESTIEYGYSLDNVNYTWQASSELKKLKAGTTYYIKTRVTNNVGKKVESEVTEYKPGEITTCNVEVPSGWSTSKTVTITGVQTGAELQYQVGATNENSWTTIGSGGTVKVEENTSVYCRLWDGTTAGIIGTGIVEGIDNVMPQALITANVGSGVSTNSNVTMNASSTTSNISGYTYQWYEVPAYAPYHTNSSNGSFPGFTLTAMVENGIEFTRASFEKTSGSDVEWRFLFFPQYPYIKGNKYILHIKGRTVDRAYATYGVRHASYPNDWVGIVWGMFGDSWSEYNMERVFLEDGLSPGLEIVTGELKVNDGGPSMKLVIDYRDAWIEEAENTSNAKVSNNLGDLLEGQTSSSLTVSGKQDKYYVAKITTGSGLVSYSNKFHVVIQ